MQKSMLQRAVDFPKNTQLAFDFTKQQLFTSKKANSFFVFWENLQLDNFLLN